ncbi:hypothetical protein SAMN05660706_11078 [Desulfoscipio geothermicus DSM 3669]|uniref:Uncharacterized protein n=1 Tax=Desulfoscipio geothermicus DSM 3669 TaxID=1121426 RepID=A0A1I6DGB0_9FIRM|nr:hypothetical protein SAMN05660706_11078 [Desulfoscipio geothermicus DSM 3669]
MPLSRHQQRMKSMQVGLFPAAFKISASTGLRFASGRIWRSCIMRRTGSYTGSFINNSFLFSSYASGLLRDSSRQFGSLSFTKSRYRRSDTSLAGNNPPAPNMPFQDRHRKRGLAPFSKSENGASPLFCPLRYCQNPHQCFAPTGLWFASPAFNSSQQSFPLINQPVIERLNRRGNQAFYQLGHCSACSTQHQSKQAKRVGNNQVDQPEG